MLHYRIHHTQPEAFVYTYIQTNLLIFYNHFSFKVTMNSTGLEFERMIYLGNYLGHCIIEFE